MSGLRLSVNLVSWRILARKGLSSMSSNLGFDTDRYSYYSASDHG